MRLKKETSKSLFEAWKTNPINPPKDSEIVEAKSIFKKITDPAYKSELPYFTISSPMQSGKTQIMIGVACLWLDRDPKSKSYITTSYTSTAHVDGLNRAVTQMNSIDYRFQRLLHFFKPHKQDDMVKNLRPQDLVFFDEDQFGTTPQAKSRYVNLSKELRDIGCTFGAVGATNISMLDASRGSDIIYHKIEPNEHYRGVPHLLRNIDNSLTNFVEYDKNNVSHIMQKLAQHSNNTEVDRFGVYIIRLKPRETMEDALSMLSDWGMPSVICMGETSNKVELNFEVYNEGLELIGLDTVDKSERTLTEIIKRTFEYSKLNGKDVALFVDGSLGCGVNLDKLVDKDLFPVQTYGELTNLYHQNKPFIKGIVESSKVVTSLLQGLLGRLCRYVDDMGEFNQTYEDLFQNMFVSFNKSTAQLGIDILENPKDFQINTDYYLDIANELGVSLYSAYDDDVYDEPSFSSAIELYENSIPSFNVEDALIGVESDDVIIKTISDAWKKYIKPNIQNGQRVPKNHIATKYASFSTYEYNQRKIGPYTKFNFVNSKNHYEKPKYGIGIDRSLGRVRLYKKDELIMDYYNIESKINTAHKNLFV
jgi:hypothetical protein